MGVARLLLPGLRGSTATWVLIGALWLVGALIAGWRSRGAEQRLVAGRVGVQNLAIQLLVAFPAVAAGTWRLLRVAPEQAGAAFVSNAIVTAIAVPLLSAVVFGLAALLVAVPLSRLRADG